MEEVINIFYKLQNTSSLNEKKLIIKQHKDNELFKFCLRFLLDGNIVSGLNDKKIKKKIKMKYDVPTFSSFKEAAEYITKHNSGNDMNISAIQAFINSQPEQHKEFYEQMFAKEFRLGCNSKVVNACIPGLIPTWEVMLGTSIEHCKIPDGVWFSLSHKLNGNRITYYDGEFYSRQNKKYIGLEHIKADIEKIPNAKNYVFDGELLYKNEEGLSDSAAFQKGTGIAQNKSGKKEELKMIIFDILPKDDFDNKISKETYKTRKQHLLDLKQYKTENIDIVEMFYEGTDQSEIWKWLDYAEEHDMEGLMLSLDAPYECKRTKNLLKIKKFFDLDLQIVGCEEGTGRNKGRLGAFIVDFKGNKVKVGSGFSDSERDSFWNDRDDLVGRVITVKYKEISKDKKTGLESLQFPVFCGLREIGKEVSYE